MWATIIAEKHAESPKLISGHANHGQPSDPLIDLGFGVHGTEAQIANIIEKQAEPAYANWIASKFGDLGSFQRKVSERAPQLLKFWPPDAPEPDRAKPALAVAK